MTVRILQGHVLDRLRELPDESVHCVIADPPYGETSLCWDKRILGWPSDLMRVLAPEASLWCFGSLRSFIEQSGQFAGYKVAQEVIWEKQNGTGLFNDRFRRVHELIVQFYPRTRKWTDIYKKPLFTNDATARTVRKKARPAHWIGAVGDTVYRSEDGGPRLMRSVWYHRNEHMRAEHPTQKPLAVVMPLIEYSCCPEGTVLDLFSGSGTACVAAARLRRNAIGIELSENYAAMARRRVEDDAGLFADIAAD